MNKQKEYLEQEADFMVKGLSQEAVESQVVFVRGEGIYLYDMNEKEYMDFSSGILTNSLGQCHEYVKQQLKEQLDTLWNIHDFASPYRLRLIKKLQKYIPEELNTFVFYTTGAEAIEASLRIISNYYMNFNKRISALRYGFHGKTMGARLLVDWRLCTDPYSNSRLAYSAMCYRCPFERNYPDCEIMCAKLACHHVCNKEDVGAIIFEPILGSAGVFIPPKEYWQIIQEECKRKGILMIDDEILTSGGRIGTFLAADMYDLRPDMIIMAKGLASGFPFSAIAGRSEIMNNELFSQPGSASATFSSHPFGIRAALATLESIEQEDIIKHVKGLERIFLNSLDEMKKNFEFIGDVRGIGLLAAIEFVKDRKTKSYDDERALEVYHAALDKGIKLCLGGNIIRICPPLNITALQLKTGMEKLYEVLKITKERMI